MYTGWKACATGTFHLLPLHQFAGGEGWGEGGGAFTPHVPQSPHSFYFLDIRQGQRIIL
jgi:hypothetical protein